MDTITRTIGVAISSRSPRAMTACGRKTSKPAQTWLNVCGKLSNLWTDKPPGWSGNMRKPIKMILALRMTPPWSIQPIMFVVNSLLSDGCSGGQARNGQVELAENEAGRGSYG